MSGKLHHMIGKIAKEGLDAFLWIGGIFALWFMIMYGHFFSFVADMRRGDEPTESAITFAVQGASTTLQPASSRSSHVGSEDIALPAGLSVASVTERMYSFSLDSYLQERLQEYQLPFSLLPPGKYVRIQRTGVEAPVIDVSYASQQQLEKGLFNDQLRQGVVRYPFTGQPGSKWNMLLFGHSSVDFREGKNNPYGFIFSKLHELQSGDIIEIVREGKQYLYEVEETVIKNPKKVNEVIQQYQDKPYLTLMACFPRFSTAQRILVIAKQLDPQKVAQSVGTLN